MSEREPVIAKYRIKWCRKTIYSGKCLFWYRKVAFLYWKR